jgi:hypothetical protein
VNLSSGFEFVTVDMDSRGDVGRWRSSSLRDAFSAFNSFIIWSISCRSVWEFPPTSVGMSGVSSAVLGVFLRGFPRPLRPPRRCRKMDVRSYWWSTCKNRGFLESSGVFFERRSCRSKDVWIRVAEFLQGGGRTQKVSDDGDFCFCVEC